MDHDKRRKYYNLCNPAEPLEPDDARRVSLNRFGVDNAYVRGQEWAGRLARRFELSDEPACVLFTGLRGSGKTTELKSLQQTLTAPDSDALFPIVIAAEDGIELTSPVDIPEIMFSIVEGAERALDELRGAAGSAAPGYCSRLWTWLAGTDVELTKIEFGTGPGPKLVTELRTRPTLRSRVRTVVEQRLSSFLDEVHAHLRDIQHQVCAHSPKYRGVVVIFDSLEKLQGTSSNWRQVVESAERLFSGGAPYLRLPVHALYTVPPSLLFRLSEPVEFLPMLKIKDRQGRRFEPGIGAARAIGLQRIPESDMQLLLGDDWGRQLDLLVEWSGGYPRDIIRVLHAVLESDELPLDHEGLERVLSHLGDEYRRIIYSEDAEWLRQVQIEKRLTVKDSQHRESVDLMLQNNIVLRYLNSEEWYDLHPALRDLPARLLEEGSD